MFWTVEAVSCDMNQQVPSSRCKGLTNKGHGGRDCLSTRCSAGRSGSVGGGHGCKRIVRRQLNHDLEFLEVAQAIAEDSRDRSCEVY